MTQVAWEMKKDEILKTEPGVTRDKFLYNLSRADYEKSWGTQYHKPGFGSKLLAVFIRIVPKIGPFRALSFRTPTLDSEKLFLESFNATLDRYRALLASERSQTVQPADVNLDVGRRTIAGQYKLADDAYAKLVDELAKKGFVGMPPELRSNILEFYKNMNAPIATKKDRKHWAKLQQQLEMLKSGERERSTRSTK